MHFLFRADLLNGPNWLLVIDKSGEETVIDTLISHQNRFSWRIDSVEPNKLLVWDNREPLAPYKAKVCVVLPGNGEDTDGAAFGPAGLAMTFDESPIRRLMPMAEVRVDRTAAVSDDPNDRQVGGQHYKGADFQPWDWPLYGVDAWSYSIVKYATRFKEKNGRQDLEKAVHFCDKLFWAITQHSFGQHNIVRIRHADEYLEQNKCDKYQRRVVLAALFWKSSDDVEHLRECLSHLIEDHDQNVALDAADELADLPPTPVTENVTLTSYDLPANLADTAPVKKRDNIDIFF